MVKSFEHKYLFGFSFEPQDDITTVELARISRMFYELSCFHSSACYLGARQGVEPTKETAAKVGAQLNFLGVTRHFKVDVNTTIPELKEVARKYLQGPDANFEDDHSPV